MYERSFDEMIAYFNRRVSEMDISQDYKMELLGMVTALGYKHEKSAQPERKTGKWIDESMVTGTSGGGITYIRQFRCSVCGNLFGRIDDRFCGKCGARMEDEP